MLFAYSWNEFWFCTILVVATWVWILKKVGASVGDEVKSAGMRGLIRLLERWLK